MRKQWIKIQIQLKFTIEADSPPPILILKYVKETFNDKSIKYFVSLKILMQVYNIINIIIIKLLNYNSFLYLF